MEYFQNKLYGTSYYMVCKPLSDLVVKLESPPYGCLPPLTRHVCQDSYNICSEDNKRNTIKRCKCILWRNVLSCMISVKPSLKRLFDSHLKLNINSIYQTNEFLVCVVWWCFWLCLLVLKFKTETKNSQIPCLCSDV